MQNVILIGANKTKNGTYSFYFRSKAGWKYEMNIIDAYGAEGIAQIAPEMSQEEYNALPNQLDISLQQKIKQS